MRTPSSSLSLFLLFLSLGLPLSSANQIQERYDCDAGCSMNAEEMGPPVCGADGLTYLNECLALCQEVAFEHFGRCDTDGGDPFDESDLSTDPEVIPRHVMNRYAGEQYRFVGKITTPLLDKPDSWDPVRMSDFDFTTSSNNSTRGHYVRFSPSEGYEYARLFSRDPEDSPTIVAPTAPYLGLVAEDATNGDAERQLHVSQRQAAVIGTDTRTAVSNTQAFPYRAIVETDYSSSRTGGCTMTMISRFSALTAGHCVWSSRDRALIGVYQIAPARYRDDDGNIVNPYGTWSVASIDVFSEFRDTGNYRFDMAVVTFQDEARDEYADRCETVYPGDVVGFVGIDRPGMSGGEVADSRLAGAAIIGYPSDRPRGEQSTSGPCSGDWFSDHPHFAYHFCDTYRGNSGSSVLTSGNIALGEHAYGFYDDDDDGVYNGAIMLTGDLYTAVYEWANVGSPDVCGITQQATCDCDRERFLFQLLCYVAQYEACLLAPFQSISGGQFRPFRRPSQQEESSTP